MGGIAYRYEAQTRELRAEFPKAYGRIKGKRWKELKGAMDKRHPKETYRDA